MRISDGHSATLIALAVSLSNNDDHYVSRSPTPTSDLGAEGGFVLPPLRQLSFESAPSTLNISNGIDPRSVMMCQAQADWPTLFMSSYETELCSGSETE